MSHWFSSPALWLVLVPILLALLVLLRRPLRLLLHLLLRSIGGFAALAALHPVSAVLGLSLGANWLNALVLGVLGVPGLGLLLMLQWLLGHP